MELYRFFISIGVFFLILGMVIYIFQHFGFTFLGNLPGDIKIEKENFRFYFPLTTSILISILLSLIFFLLKFLIKIKDYK
ncbi:MAG: DUF2905 domain-containing protein [Leptonema sp. (in: bacteria)]